LLFAKLYIYIQFIYFIHLASLVENVEMSKVPVRYLKIIGVTSIIWFLMNLALWRYYTNCNASSLYNKCYGNEKRLIPVLHLDMQNGLIAHFFPQGMFFLIFNTNIFKQLLVLSGSFTCFTTRLSCFTTSALKHNIVARMK